MRVRRRKTVTFDEAAFVTRIQNTLSALSEIDAQVPDCSPETFRDAMSSYCLGQLLEAMYGAEQK